MQKLFFYALTFTTMMFYACSDTDLKQENLEAQVLSAKVNGDVEVDASHQEEANQKLTKLLETFGKTKNRMHKERPDYPAYYGGAYINANGGLALYVTGDFEKGKRFFTNIIGDANVEFKAADYSYAYLTDVMDQLNEFVIARKNPSAIQNFNIFSLSDIENRIVVQLNEFNDSKIIEFKKSVLNSPAIIFKESEGEFVLEVDLHPGGLVSDASNQASFGFRAKRNSDDAEGMVVSGHLASVGENIYYSNSTTQIIGVCSASQVSGTIDAAFVPVTNTSAYMPSNVLSGTTNLLSTITSNPGVGTTINKIGSATGPTSGDIISTNTTWTSTSTGNVLTDMTSADYTSAGGDSGGIVYSFLSGTGTRPTVGIHVGATGSTRYYCKATNVLSTLSIYRY